MLKKLLGNRLRLDALRHEEVPLVAQDTDDLGGQYLIEDMDCLRQVTSIRRCDGAFTYVFPCAPAQLFDVAEEGFVVFLSQI